jgi:cyclohexanecarboxylate-CoA ligase
VDSVFVEPWNPNFAARAIEVHGVRDARGAPIFLDSLLRASGGMRIGRLGSFLCGGAEVPTDLVLRAQVAGIAAYNSYGMSEHPSIASGFSTESLERRAAGICTPHPGCEIRIVDPYGARVPVGTIGQITTQGAEQFVGYSDGDNGRDERGWFHTGDLGSLDADGCLRVTGRIKDVIIRGGETISAPEVEGLLRRHQSIIDAAVVPIPDDQYGERILAFLVTESNLPISEIDVRQHFATLGVDLHKAPEVVRVVDALPRTASGKVAKAMLKRAAQGDANT